MSIYVQLKADVKVFFFSKGVDAWIGGQAPENTPVLYQVTEPNVNLGSGISLTNITITVYGVL